MATECDEGVPALGELLQAVHAHWALGRGGDIEQKLLQDSVFKFIINTFVSLLITWSGPAC